MMTDSGGVQEESCILKTPCLTIRENTERPETVDVGANILVGRSTSRAVEAIDILLSSKLEWKNPFGDGTASKKILDLVTEGRIQKQTSGSISVIGLGYMGLPISLVLADCGWKVQGVDISEEKIRSYKEGRIDIDEPGLDELFDRVRDEKNWNVSTILKEKTDFYLISVPTPHSNQTCDLTYVKKACESVAEHCEEGACVIIESTIAPGAMKNHVEPIFRSSNKKVHLAHCPERAIPGQTLKELVENDRIVGGLTDEATEKAFKVFDSFSNGQVLKTRAEVAEAAKLMENAFRDVNIALANEFDEVLNELNISTEESIRMAIDILE